MLQLEQATLITVEPINVSLKEGMWRTDGNEVRFSWNTDSPVNVEGLVKVRVMAQQSGYLSEMINIDERFMAAELYDADENTHGISLHWRESFEAPVTAELQLHQNNPNPWQTETVIPFEIPGGGDVQLTITNSIGTEIYNTTTSFASGKQQYTLTNTQWPDGLYYYSLRFGETQMTKTMLILNKH